MPMPIGGAFALNHARYYEKNEREKVFNPELEEFRKQQKYITSNIKCTIEFAKGVIPADKGTMEGLLVLEALEDVEHSGIFILMKGLPIPDKKPKPKQRRVLKPLNEVRLTVLESTFSGGELDTMQIDGGSTETYPVELEIPDELPVPLLNSTGRLIYKVHVYMVTSKTRSVVVGETALRWQGHRRLSEEELSKELRIEQQVHSKRALMGLGWRKSGLVEWRVGKGGYLPGERIQVELWGECKEKDGLQLEFKVELVQKVWYQVPADLQVGKMYTKMKVNVLASGGTIGEEDAIEIKNEEEEEGDEDDGEEKKLVWQAKLQVPRGITPTIRFDFENSVSYTIRTSIVVAGEGKECWVTAEVPLLIGNCKEVVDEDEVDGCDNNDDDEDDEEEDLNRRSPSPSPRGSSSPCNDEKGIMHRPRSGSFGTPTDDTRSHTMSFIPSWARPRRGSISSMESFASSTLSMFRFPPTYSELSSTMETMPPAYGELELQEPVVVPSIVVHQQTEEENTITQGMGSDDLEEGSEAANTK